MKSNKENLGMLLGLVGVLMFSLSLPMTRLAVKEIDPVWLALARAALAAALGAISLAWFRVPFPHRDLWPKVFWTIVGVIFGFPIFSSIAMRYTDASHGAVVNGLLPLATAIFVSLLSTEKPSKAFWVSAIAGSALVVGYALWQSNGTLQIGDASMLLAVVAGGIGYALGGKLSQAIGGWQAISWSLVCALPCIALGFCILSWFRGGFLESIAAGGGSNISSISWQSWAAFLYVAIFSQLIGFFFWYGGMAIGGVARVSQVQLLQLFFTLIFAALINQETVTFVTWLVGFLVVMVIVINKKTAIGTKRSSTN
jgi:drug/metabolite transporter (DMT)-like permease